ncbi:MAG: hypothetical protein CL808_01170 [Citromicrobium sp.]|nr:hypothetical protein [Citromicrobium sp.]
MNACATYPEDNLGSSSCGYDSRDWQAETLTIVGSDAQSTLTITGEVDMPTPGWSLELIEGPADRMQPPGLRFRLEAEGPDGIVTQVITPTKVRYEAPTPYSDIREIIITCGDETLVTIDNVRKKMRETTRVGQR